MTDDVAVNKYILRTEKRYRCHIFDKTIFPFYIKILNDELIITLCRESTKEFAVFITIYIRNFSKNFDYFK